MAAHLFAFFSYVLLSLGSPAQSGEFAVSEIQAVVRCALEEVWLSNEGPRIDSLFPGVVDIPIQREVLGVKGLLGPEAVPRADRLRFYLLSTEEAQEVADRSGRVLRFVTVEYPRIEGSEAQVTLGTDIAVPASWNTGKLCCCKWRAILRLEAGRWHIVETQLRSCS